MSVSNGIISAPIGLQEVYGVLGVSKSGTFYDLGYICSNAHGKINPWSRNKPIKFDTQAELTAHQMKGMTGNCGFIGIGTYGYANLMKAYLTGMAWKYDPPVPGTDWCRLTDFNGYAHNAQPFVMSNVEEGESHVVWLLTDYKSITFTFTCPREPGSLEISDFDTSNAGSALAQAKLAALVYRGTGVTEDPQVTLDDVQYGDTVNGNDNPSITVDFSGMQAGQKVVVLCLTWQTSTESYLPLPYFDSAHFWWCSVNLRDDAAFGAKISINEIGFTGEHCDTPLTPVSSFTESNPLRVEERGAMKVQLIVAVDSNMPDYAINGNTQLKIMVTYVNVSGGVQKLSLGSLKITEINGASYTGGNIYTVKAGQRALVLLASIQSDVVFPSNIADCQATLGVYDDRFSSAQSPSAQAGISIDVYPFK